MSFQWDEIKNQANIAKHGIDFCYAVKVFDDDKRLEWQDTRFDYGERRYVTIGYIESMCYTVVYTIRIKDYRIISARGASRNEREAYKNYYASS
jgi:uncharacterized protein